MVSTSLHDPPAIPRWDASLRQPAPRVTVSLLDADPSAHHAAREAAVQSAWEIAFHMTDALFSRTAAAIASLRRGQNPPAPARPYAPDAVCRSVRTLVELNGAARAFARLEADLASHAAHLVQLLAGITEASGVFAGLAKTWTLFAASVAELAEVWVYLDRWFVRRRTAARSLTDRAVWALREALLRDAWLMPRGQAGYLDAIRSDHLAPSAARAELRAFTDLCVAAQVYFAQLEPEVMAVATAFYTEWADAVWADGTKAEVYFARVEQFLEEARERVRLSLDPASMPKMEATAQTSLLMKYGVQFLERDFARLVEEQRFDVLRLAWDLLAAGKYVRLGKPCGAVFRQYILHNGVRIMQQLHPGNQRGNPLGSPLPVEGHNKANSNRGGSGKEDAFAVVRSMITLMYRGERVIENGFAEESMLFSVQLRDALGEAMQENQPAFAEQLSRYMDWIMYEGEVGNIPSESDAAMTIPTSSTEHMEPTQPVTMEATIGDVARIYSLFPAKDLFEGFYWRDFARRLLNHQRTPRLDKENFFLQRIKDDSGAEISKFEGMLNDLRTSEEMNEQFRSWVAARLAGEADTNWSWPTRTDVERSEESEAPHATSPVPSNPPLPVSPTQAMGKRENENEEDDKEGPERKPPAKEEEQGEEEEEDDNEEPISPTLTNTILARVEVKLRILTNGFWPQQAPLAMRLPLPLRALQRGVRAFYRRGFSDRRLVWQHQLSSAVILSSLGGTRRRLTGTFVQAALLLTLGDTPEAVVTVGALCAQLGVDPTCPDVAGALLGLCQAKTRLLLLHPTSAAEGGDSAREETPTGDGACHATNPNATALCAGDQLVLNAHFTMPTTRGRIPFLNPRRRGAGDGGAEKDEADTQRTAERIMAERAHVIEAEIVRFMKEKRRVSHDEVIQTVTSRVRFPVTMAGLKKVIERLIEREFIDRNGPTTYTYRS